jgi:CHAT domain-containing protein
MEAAAGLGLPAMATETGLPAADTLQQVRGILGPDEVYFGFDLDENTSWLWVIARDGFQLRQLPPRAQVAATARPFSRAVSENAPDAALLGRRLYTELFGGVARQFLDKPLWIVAPDDALFDVPFAALVEDPSSLAGHPPYVVEHHAIQLTPGIWSQSGSRPMSAGGPFVGLGDPIYNFADPRCPRPIVAAGPSGRPDTSGRSLGPALQFPRLVGSDLEIEKCARLWETRGSPAILLQGGAASKENLVDALRRAPAVLHVAAHILFPAQNRGAGFIALTIQPDGGAELLSTTEIGSLRTRVGLVILNGCGSARGVVLPGAGLMGMTRAWLAAGAQAVVATRWAMLNDSGEFFQHFYKSLQAHGRPLERNSLARALAQAQVTFLRSGGRQAAPAYWSAYMLIGRN